MSTEEKLAWVSLFVGILSLIVALPALVTQYTTVGSTLILVALVLIGVFVWVRWFLNQPDFTLLDVDKTLTFRDRDARSVSHVDTRTVRPNHKGLVEFWFKGLGADGSVENILVDDQQPHVVQVRAGLKEVCKRFPSSLERGQKFRTTATLDFIDSFPDNPEFYTHRVSTNTKKVRLKVRFHPEKRCTSARVYLQFGGAQYQLLRNPRLEISEDGKEIGLTLKRPKRGEEYRLEWNW